MKPLEEPHVTFRTPEVAELRVSVPETGGRLLPVAAWHAAVGRATVDMIAMGNNGILAVRHRAKLEILVTVAVIRSGIGVPGPASLTHLDLACVGMVSFFKTSAIYETRSCAHGL